MTWFELNNALDLLWEKQQKSNLETKASMDKLLAQVNVLTAQWDKLLTKIERIEKLAEALHEYDKD